MEDLIIHFWLLVILFSPAILAVLLLVLFSFNLLDARLSNTENKTMD
jgi:hypothetical protein